MPMNAVYAKPADLTQVIPVFPLPGALLLPRGQMPLNIFEPRYVAMVDDALAGRRLIGMIQPDTGDPGPETGPKVGQVEQMGRPGIPKRAATLLATDEFRAVVPRARILAKLGTVVSQKREIRLIMGHNPRGDMAEVVEDIPDVECPRQGRQ